jgi:fructose-bisphosphate aldolase class 1
MLMFCGAVAFALAPIVCPAQISQTADARKYDEFLNINCEDEMARLDNFAIELQYYTGLDAYVIVYAGRVSRINEAMARAQRIRLYLVKNRHIEARRVVLVNGGYREESAVELWLLPRGARPPVPTPTLSRKEVRVRKKRARVVDCAAAF